MLLTFFTGCKSFDPFPETEDAGMITGTSYVRVQYAGDKSDIGIGLYSMTRNKVVFKKYFTKHGVSEYFSVSLHEGETFTLWVDWGDKQTLSQESIYDVSLTNKHKYSIKIEGLYYYYDASLVDETNMTDYYIKHSWGSGSDSDWSWKKMEKQGDETFTYDGLWGGVGANINTKADDNGAIWFNRNSISGYASLTVGDEARFTYNISNNSLSVTKISSGGGYNTAEVRFYRKTTYIYCTAMALRNSNDYVVARYDFDESFYGYSSYYYVQAGTYYPYYFDGESWNRALKSPYYYQFEAGKKYTFACDDDGSYLTFSIISDGSYYAPVKHLTPNNTKDFE